MPEGPYPKTGNVIAKAFDVGRDLKLLKKNSSYKMKDPSIMNGYSCTIPVDWKPAICPCICRCAFPATGASTIWLEPLDSIRRVQLQCRDDHGMVIHAIRPGFSHCGSSCYRPGDICHSKIGGRNHLTLTVRVEYSGRTSRMWSSVILTAAIRAADLPGSGVHAAGQNIF